MPGWRQALKAVVSWEDSSVQTTVGRRGGDGERFDDAAGDKVCMQISRQRAFQRAEDELACFPLFSCRHVRGLRLNATNCNRSIRRGVHFFTGEEEGCNTPPWGQ